MINYTTATNGNTTKTFKNPPPTSSRFNIFKYLSAFALVMLLGVNGVMGQLSITSLPANYSNNFSNYNPTIVGNVPSTINSSGTSTAGLSIATTGWTVSSTSAAYNGRGTGSGNTGGFYGYYTGSGTEISLGALPSGTSNTHTYTISFTNNSGSTITSLTMAWDYEQWRYGGSNTSGWDCTGTGQLSANSTLNGKDFSGANSTAGAISGGLTTAISSFTLSGLSIANGQSFGITWVTTNLSGTDNGVAIDNFTISASVTATPSIAISNGTIAAGSPNNGQTNVVLQRYDMAVTTADATLTGLTVTTAGTYAAADLSNLKCWYQTSTTFNSGTATLLSTKSTSLGSGSQVFPSFTSQAITSGNTGYIFVTADIASGATNGNTINIASTAHSNITFSSGTKTGTDPVAAAGLQTITVAVPDIELSSPAASASNITVGTTNNVVYRFDLVITTATPSLTGVTINTSSGTNIAGDLTNLKCWYQTSTTFNSGTATLLSTKTTSLAAGSQVFPTFSSQSLTTGSTYYIFITADVPLTATPSNTIIVSAIATSDLTFDTGNKTGSANASGTKTLIDCTPTDVSSAAASSASVSSVLTWVNPTCYDEILIVAALASNSGSPSGDGSSYTSNLAYGSGTAFGNGFVVYKGSTSSQTVTGLTNGTQYFYKFFTRRGSVWSAGTEVNATPTNVSVGDFRSNVTTGNWSTAGSWQTWNGSAWVVAGAAPTSGSTANNVTVRSGHTITLTAGNVACNSLTVESMGKLFANNATNRYIDILGNMICDGTIGNGSTADGISFNIEGSSCLISGSGNFDCARMRKAAVTNATTTLTISMNVNARYNGTAVYSNIAATTFNVIISSGSTLSCPGDATTNSCGLVAIDGTNGAGTGEIGGTITVNGTLTISGIGTSQPLLYAKTNNTTSAVAINIGATGIVNTPAVDFGASGAGGHAFSIASGGTLNITDQPTSFVTPSNSNNTYTFNANSNINYNKSGAQTIYTFGSLVNQGNITLSGSGVKSVPSTGILNVNGTLTTGGLLTLLSDASGTASIGALTTGSVSGNVTVQRFVSSVARKYRFLASPIASSSSKTIADWMTQFYVTGPCTASPSGGLGSINDQGWHTSQANISYPGAYNASTNPFGVRYTSIRTYDETVTGSLDLGFTDVTTSTALTPGKGFKAFIRGAIGNTGQLNGLVTGQTAVTLSLTGAVNQGDVNSNATFTSSGTAANDGWNLVGNPYPCAYNLKAQYDAAQTSDFNNISSQFHVYNGATGSYASYNANGGATVGALTNGIIPSGSAFFIQATATPTFIFKESYKTSTAPGILHKTTNTTDFAIKYSKDSTESDYLTVKMYDNATLNYDAFDIKKLRNENLNLAAYGSDVQDLAATVIPFITEETRIKLNVEATEVGTYKFEFTNMDNFDAGVSVSLYDRYTNTTTDVKKNTKYTFDMGAGVNQWGKNRFELILNGKATTGVNENTNNVEYTTLSVYPNPATDVLNISLSNGTSIETVNIYNVSGKLVNNIKLNGNQIDISQLNNGVYMVEVLTANGTFKTKFVK